MRSKIEIYKLCNRYNRNKPEDTEYSRIRLRHIDRVWQIIAGLICKNNLFEIVV